MTNARDCPEFSQEIHLPLQMMDICLGLNINEMKTPLRFLLALIFIGSQLGLHAQVIFSEDFDGIGGPTAGGAGTYSFPAGWLKRNVDNRTPDPAVSYVNEAWERREDFSTNVADSVAFSTSWYSPTGAADDWMWTPLIGPLPANAELKWNAKAYDPLYPDGYSVRIMTSLQGPPTGGTGVLGNQVSNSTQIFSVPSEASTWTNHTVSLAAYAGQSVYIGFRNNSNDMFLLVIDDVEVFVTVVNDAATILKDTLEYTLVPERQQSTAPFHATIRNNGTNTINTPYLKVLVRNGAGAIVYNANSATIPSLAAGATATFTVPGAGNLPPDYYTVQYVATHALSDPNAANDTLVNTYIVDAQTYARDNGVVTGSLGIGAGNGGFVGQDFDFVQSDVIDTVMVYFTKGYSGQNIQLNVYSSGLAGPTTLVGTTTLQQYPDDSARAYMLALQGGGVAVNGGNTYAFEVVEFDSTLAVGTTPAIFTPNSTWINWPTNPFGNWANNEEFGPNFAKPFVIRPMTACNDFAVSAITSTPSCTGNNGTASVLTSVGQSPAAGYLWSNGATTASVSNLAPGSYTVTVSLLGTCSDTATINVPSVSSNPPAATATATDANCFGDNGLANVVASGGTPGYSYLWSNGDTTTALTAPAGTYAVTVTDAQGCAAMDTVTINQPSAILPTVTSTLETASGTNDGTATANPTGGTPPYTYLWSNGGTTATISNLPVGTYVVTVTDANGCTAFDSTTVITGLSGHAGISKFVAFPSPNDGIFQVEFRADGMNDLTLEVLDLAGKRIYSTDFAQTNGFLQEIDLKNQAAGMYFVRLRIGEATLTTKVELK
jgi:hypothetical protein